MSTTPNSTTPSSKAQALAVVNRLQRDLDELTRATKGAGLLPADDDGMLFDAACHLSGALASVQQAIASLSSYAGNRPATPNDVARREQARRRAMEISAEIYG